MQTERLSLRRLTYDDWAFVSELVNEPTFKAFIGDKNVHTRDDAVRFLREGPVGSYEKHGFGLLLVTRSRDDMALGICGLVRRDGLDDPDLGFAFLARHRGNGYGLESARAVLNHARRQLGLRRIVALVDADNSSSVRLLGKLGFRFERTMRLPGETHDVQLHAIDT